MKRKEILLNISLVILVFLTILQASLLWIKIPKLNRGAVVQEQYNTEDFFKEFLKPKKMIVNFGGDFHTVVYDFSETWKNYINLVSTVFLKVAPDNLTEISPVKYMDLQEDDSIVFVFNREVSGNLFLNLIGKTPHSPAREDTGIKELYISKDNLILTNSHGIFQVNLNIKKDPTDVLNGFNQETTKRYNNFYEKYNILSNVYVPTDDEYDYKEVYFQNEIKTMPKQYKNNLASRVLNENIDYIREITQQDGTTYVYEDRFLKLLSSGLIYYEDPENFETKERNMYVSLKSAINFMTSKMGISNSIKLSGFEPIKFGNNLGYRLLFNFTEESIPVYLKDKSLENYISIDVFSDHIKSYKQFYRGVVSKPQEIYKVTDQYSVKDLIKDNLGVFVNQSDGVVEMHEILAAISDCDFVYVDTAPNEEKTKLVPAIRIIYKDRNLFFNMKNGKFLMER